LRKVTVWVVFFKVTVAIVNYDYPGWNLLIFYHEFGRLVKVEASQILSMMQASMIIIGKIIPCRSNLL